MLHAARLTGRPVKWANDRSGSFLSDHHGRAQEVDGELALDAKGRFLAVRLTGFGDMGAYLTRFGPLIPSLNWVKNVVGPYRTRSSKSRRNACSPTPCRSAPIAARDGPRPCISWSG